MECGLLTFCTLLVAFLIHVR